MSDRFPIFGSPAYIPCGNCPAGQMHSQHVTYFTWLGDQLITVPDFPAWVCDVCGRREYDPRALNQLSLILAPNAGKSTRKHSLPRRANPKRKGSRSTPAG
ncbi:MAG TPA: YgiT-type zinc finger protein [Anaerolineaceae bacterium]|jgi:YgiT-type zinc finger domain-containing protein|nr:YgiT-type zinc finger protein [Longilinea sp.]NMD30511.1 YgiT-type zinc finger protein [Chloroflexota bacterium]HNS62932.1 YgiT-type zinc finger protein [Anaerolineaceae bacterium]HNZ00428.1 YgiT-type zinc finger protein [Anaerolineaceae bacterium]HOD43922.1 YgiT-type zinc finger protein [Anaerolineaceae bacterium]